MYIPRVILVNCPACTRCPAAPETTAQALPVATRALEMAPRAYPDAANAVEVSSRACLGAALEATAPNKTPSFRPQPRNVPQWHKYVYTCICINLCPSDAKDFI